jgi:hypothetical protein
MPHVEPPGWPDQLSTAHSPRKLRPPPTSCAVRIGPIPTGWKRYGADQRVEDQPLRANRVTMPGHVLGIAAAYAGRAGVCDSHDGRNLRTTVLVALDLAGTTMWRRQLTVTTVLRGRPHAAPYG